MCSPGHGAAWLAQIRRQVAGAGAAAGHFKASKIIPQALQCARYNCNPHAMSSSTSLTPLSADRADRPDLRELRDTPDACDAVAPAPARVDRDPRVERDRLLRPDSSSRDRFVDAERPETDAGCAWVARARLDVRRRGLYADAASDIKDDEAPDIDDPSVWLAPMLLAPGNVVPE